MTKDRFSSHADSYVVFRPTYPSALYDFVGSLTEKKEKAWDVGCGNGQVSTDLAPRFHSVVATDISGKQIENAPKLPNVSYHMCPAEQTPFAADTFDLITVGQALHWFRINEFFSEATRVGKNNAIVAVWGYGLLQIDSVIDPQIQHFYKHVVGPYWDRERKLVDEQYQDIPFPFEEIQSPAFQFTFQWSFQQLYGYLTTWSSVQKYKAQHQVNPVDSLTETIRDHFGSEPRTISFPLFTRIGRIRK